jgi:GntR family transcriptional regulator, transcriptional repressor for pyruvate dehydrogenase complex
VLAWAAGNDILISIRWLLLAWIRRAVNAAGKTGSTVEEHAAVLDAVGGEVAAACGGVDAALLDSAAIRVLDSLTEGEVG